MNPQREPTPSPQQPDAHRHQDASREQTALENVSQGYGKAGSAHISGKPGPVTESDGIRPGPDKG